MNPEQQEAIEAAKRELDLAFGLSEAPSWAAGAGVHEPSPQREAPGELQRLGSGPPMSEEAIQEGTRRLRGRSAIAAEAVKLALADIRKLELEDRGLEALRIVAGCYVHDLVLGIIEPCGCGDPVNFSEDDDGVVLVRCHECSTAWLLKPWLSATIKRIQASEAIRLGRPLTPWEAHSIDDQCYFRTLPRGAVGLTGGTPV